MNFAIITVSDTCSKDPSKDASGPALQAEVEKLFPSSLFQTKVLPDEQDLIAKELCYFCDFKKVSAIFTTGGTGFATRDVTPEATRTIIEKEAPAIATAMTVQSMKHTDMAILSRATAGIRGKTLIINFPGSVKAVKECFNSISKALPHALSLLNDDIASVTQTHVSLNGETYSKHVCTHTKKSDVDISKVALRERNSPFPMLSVDEATKIIEKEMRPLFKSRTDIKTLSDCLGCVPVDDIVAVEPLPPFPASIKDGYACIAADVAGFRKVRGTVCAGDVAEEPLQRGECVRINTGAPLPPGADCVIQVEDTKLLRSSEDGRTEHEIEVLRQLKVGEDVRPIGHDIRQGEVVVKAETLLDAGNIGILATVGTTKVRVYKQPVVGLLSTGNELQNPEDAVLKPGHIRDSNKIMLTTLLREYGFESVDCGISKDDPDSMKTAIASALSMVDILISTGSVSMGERDMLKPVLHSDFKSIIHFGRTNMKPGKPTTFATCDFEGERKYIFGLPGNPVSAFVTSLLFVIPSLKRCVGSDGRWMEIPVTLEDDVKLDPRPEYARATLNHGADGLSVRLTGNQCSSRLLSTCGAAVLVALPGATGARDRLGKGASVTALLTTRPRYSSV